ncbi:MAG: alpha/beta hydrolase [Candidatus Thorarchaeota archaeon]
MSQKVNERYIKTKFHAKSLEDNPLGTPSDRELAIYLPPDYFKDETSRFPVIYFLHGYGGGKQFTVLEDLETFFGGKQRMEQIKGFIDIDLNEIPTYEKFDELINAGELPPLIFVQPDGSLQREPIYDFSAIGRPWMMKGSFYVNSPNSGNYEDYIVQDVIDYIDNNYQTYPNRSSRGLIGGSMGASGTIHLSARNPDKFIAVSALSGAPQLYQSEYQAITRRQQPMNLIPGLKNLGISEDTVKDLFQKFWEEVTDSLRLVLYPEDYSISTTVKEDPDGIISIDPSAFDDFREKWDIFFIQPLKDKIESFKEVKLQIKCHTLDPVVSWVETFHQLLDFLKISHDFELYRGSEYAYSPHIFGIMLTIIPAMKFCVKHFKTKN